MRERNDWNVAHGMEERWRELRFGLEIEFVGGEPERLELLPGWTMALDEKQIDGDGEASGSELQSPPLRWEELDQAEAMLERLRRQGAQANWSCGLHVHVGLEPFGEAALPALLEAALSSQEALSSLLGTSPHRRFYAPPITAEMAEAFRASGDLAALRRSGRPQSHRCGINLRPWSEIGTVEIRYANGTLEAAEVRRVVELCLRFVDGACRGQRMPDEPAALAAALGAPSGGYPPRADPPRWHRERIALENALLPQLAAQAAELVPGGEIHHIVAADGGVMVAVEDEEGSLHRFRCALAAGGLEPLGDG
ncbi:amidoligase family protein [Paenibacillus sp. B01]|uniref:amidoligase family protein n=1 Tax=Paenibacillus sp. B01 TaxID=2660554 RepID=UPI001891C6B8|nr:amidoligase family protein [Paenibacillus sp. B01]